MLPRNLASACGIDLYLRLDVTRDLLLLVTLAAAVLLLASRMAVTAAEADAVKGLASVAAGWKRRSLRAMLLLAVGFSLAASFVAVRVIEDGFRYRTGCGDGDGRIGFPSSLLAVALMSPMVLVHGVFAWAAVSKH